MAYLIDERTFVFFYARERRSKPDLIKPGFVTLRLVTSVSAGDFVAQSVSAGDFVVHFVFKTVLLINL